ncbi:gliding motility-associated C-terminal domain-containing protein [Psychroserpens sp. Hel_I_66]|uniref:T9SS type B sorting domain-containing protein n=1 Tax=Psychroserpens sp. Hel_I_66 TaxID=1250004 RepID=UPI0006467544|nr:gliding motility-associated C-terminal domain-containing protein [Psychroserpens sp. Hel_I_66]
MHLKQTTNKLYLFLSISFLFYLGNLNAQIVIGTPGLGFSQACASESFNTYSTTFVFSPESGLDSSNQFSIELSNAEGDFSDATVIFTSSAGAITTSPATLNFSLPTNTSGENYRIRIKSSAPLATSSGSASFAAYYKIQDSPFTINNLVSTGVYCAGGSYLLTIDNPGNGSNDSPLNYPNLSFKWFKETGPTSSVFVSEGNSLVVSQEGTYFVETNYGTCTSDSFSNRVSISEVTTGSADAGISSSLGNPFCPNNDMTTLTTITGNAYQWFKDGEVIADATNQMYETSTSGTYAVQVDLGECMAVGVIELVSELFDASINVDEINTLEDGESLSVEVTTNANAPDYKWYLNDNIIADISEANYNATEIGIYKVIVTENSGCIGSREFTFEIEEAFDPFPEVENIPNVISPNGDGINDTWVIPTQYVSGTDTEVMIMTNRGKIVLQTNDYLNNWPESDLGQTSINQVFYYIITTPNNDVKKGSITVVK